MRITTFLITLVLAAAAAAPAGACTRSDGGWGPHISWQEAPSQLRPGEVALEVMFKRAAAPGEVPIGDPFEQVAIPREPGDQGYVVTMCFHRNRIFQVTRVLGGDDPDLGSILIDGDYVLSTDTPLILVGQLAPLKAKFAATPGVDGGLRKLIPRPPPQ